MQLADLIQKLYKTGCKLPIGAEVYIETEEGKKVIMDIVPERVSKPKDIIIRVRNA